MDELRDQILVMLEMEEIYACPDYMSPCQNTEQKHAAETSTSQSQDHSVSFVQECAQLVANLSMTDEDQQEAKSPTDVIGRSSSPRGVASAKALWGVESSDRDHLDPWRRQMCTWAYTVVDTFGHDRGVVAVAFDMLDRYLAKGCLDEIPYVTRGEFQLISMTCLYIAVKITEPTRKISLEALKDMSRGVYSLADFRATEMDILLACEWRVNPPTAAGMCCLLLDSMKNVSVDMRDSCLDICDRTVSDARLISEKPSAIAMAAILLSARRHNYSQRKLDDFCRDLENEIDTNSESVLVVMQHLRVEYHLTSYDRLPNEIQGKAMQYYWQC